MDVMKVYYASEVTEGNQKTKFTEVLGEQPLPENTQSDESDRYGYMSRSGTPSPVSSFIEGERLPMLCAGPSTLVVYLGEHHVCHSDTSCLDYAFHSAP